MYLEWNVFLSLHKYVSSFCFFRYPVLCNPLDITWYLIWRSTIGCPNKSARFNFVINAPFIQKVLIFLFQYKVHILRLIVEYNIRQMSPTTLLSRGGRQCVHFKSCALVGTPHVCVLAPLEVNCILTPKSDEKCAYNILLKRSSFSCGIFQDRTFPQNPLFYPTFPIPLISVLYALPVSVSCVWKQEESGLKAEIEWE